MKIQHIILILAIMAPVQIYALDDVFGWGNTTWGMHPEQLVEYYKDDLTIIQNEIGAAYEIHNYEIYGQAFNVLFRWSNNKLIGVNVGRNFDVYLPTLADNIEASLRSKYGNPTTIDEFEGIFNLMTWVFPSTIITFGNTGFLNEEGGVVVHTISIGYSPNLADKL